MRVKCIKCVVFCKQPSGDRSSSSGDEDQKSSRSKDKDSSHSKKSTSASAASHAKTSSSTDASVKKDPKKDKSDKVCEFNSGVEYDIQGEYCCDMLNE